MTFRCLSDDSEISFDWIEIKVSVRLELSHDYIRIGPKWYNKHVEAIRIDTWTLLLLHPEGEVCTDCKSVYLPRGLQSEYLCLDGKCVVSLKPSKYWN